MLCTHARTPGNPTTRRLVVGVMALALVAGGALAQPRHAVPGESRQYGFDTAPSPGATATPDSKGLGQWRPLRAGAADDTAALFAWSVEPVEGTRSAPAALVVRPSGTKGGLGLAAAGELVVRDVAVSAWIRADVSSSAGVAWRVGSPTGSLVRDGYFAGWSPADRAFRVWVMKDGQRRELARTEVAAQAGRWYAVSVAHVGNRIEATFEGASRLTVEDSTWVAEGACAVWAESAGVAGVAVGSGAGAVAFDDVSIADVTPEASTPRGLIALEARRVMPLVKSAFARLFLASAAALPAVAGPRTVWFDRAAVKAYAGAEADALTDEQRAAMREMTLDERFYYLTRYGSPVAYARALDLAAGHGFSGAAGARVLDYGYGGIGHLRMLASLGLIATGVDVDPILAALYSKPEDTGEIPRFGPAGRAAEAKAESAKGRVAVLTGRWPGDEPVRTGAGEPGTLDLFISKNTLKNGYLHPAEKVDPRMLVNLGVSDEAFVNAVFEALRPGGVMMIYNICPAPSVPPQPYKPWADGRCPFSREMLEAAGFEVAAFDVVDDEPIRAQARALGWDRGEQPMNLEADLFAWYTVAKKPGK